MLHHPMDSNPAKGTPPFPSVNTTQRMESRPRTPPPNTAKKRRQSHRLPETDPDTASSINRQIWTPSHFRTRAVVYRTGMSYIPLKYTRYCGSITGLRTVTPSCGIWSETTRYSSHDPCLLNTFCVCNRTNRWLVSTLIYAFQTTWWRRF